MSIKDFSQENIATAFTPTVKPAAAVVTLSALLDCHSNLDEMRHVLQTLKARGHYIICYVQAATLGTQSRVMKSYVDFFDKNPDLTPDCMMLYICKEIDIDDAEILVREVEKRYGWANVKTYIDDNQPRLEAVAPRVKNWTLFNFGSIEAQGGKHDAPVQEEAKHIYAPANPTASYIPA